MKTLQEIKDILNQHRKNLFSEYPLKSIAIFGSYSRAEQNQSSDLDILVEFSDPIGIRFIDLADDLEALIGMKVDIVSKKGVKAKYLESIVKDLIYV
ncbi:nucleotidyltransferase family protein [Pedobacter sp. SL55]|uniref:nucleotidyltransferase family protein n=1 Tax=Pedobacter sp. SL55 TaxID=2995161 RepID=UPI002270D449|nr:nucleotidyltransferase family protein [Pedobacter sp. SL55]WAC41892.1 nucleotidyltransferase family protein [Pedobacter sp. SL55]